MRTALVALAVSSIGFPAAAQPFDTFRTFCLDTGGRLDRVRLAASAAGWSDATPPAERMSAEVTLMTPPPGQDASSTGLLMFGLMEEAEGDSLEVCSVLGGVSSDALISSMESWSGSAAGTTGSGNPGWVFTGSGAGITPRPDLVDADTPELRSVAEAEGTVYGVGVRVANGGPLIFQFRVPAP